MQPYINYIIKTNLKNLKISIPTCLNFPTILRNSFKARIFFNPIVQTKIFVWNDKVHYNPWFKRAGNKYTLS